MALTPRLEIRQSQSLTLTPQLMLSIKLLQFSHLELKSFVEEEMLRNPLLDREETTESALSTSQGSPEPASSQQSNVNNVEGVRQPEIAELDTADLQSASSIADTMDTDAASLFPEQVGQDSLRASTQNHSQSQRPPGSEPGDISEYVSAPTTLGDYLADQIHVLVDTPAERLIAHNLLNNLDEKGYLDISCSMIAGQLGTDLSAVERVLGRLQTCEPAGVFARNLGECLALQLAEKDRLDPMMQSLLENLPLVAAHDFSTLKKTTGASDDDLAGMLDEIRQLDPRPGRAFDGAPMQPVIADIFVREGVDGEWVIELNTDILPKVLVNRTYYAKLSKRGSRGKEKAFLVDCLQTANWLTKSLDQRARTMLKTATEIVRMQDAFLLHGVTRLKPMTLKMVAEAIEMHESTISRVTSNKYISTPRGLFEMKYFFTTALGSASGASEHSAESVRHLIKQMIDAEDPGKTLSDDTIAARLRDDVNVDVARRTVAKYREGMHIPSSVVRRRQKKALNGAE
jgi:RNA polymerase sigma-54 factor